MYADDAWFAGDGVGLLDNSRPRVRSQHAPGQGTKTVRNRAADDIVVQQIEIGGHNAQGFRQSAAQLVDQQVVQRLGRQTAEH